MTAQPRTSAFPLQAQPTRERGQLGPSGASPVPERGKAEALGEMTRSADDTGSRRAS